MSADDNRGGGDGCFLIMLLLATSAGLVFANDRQDRQIRQIRLAVEQYGIVVEKPVTSPSAPPLSPSPCRPEPRAVSRRSRSRSIRG